MVTKKHTTENKMGYRSEVYIGIPTDYAKELESLDWKEDYNHSFNDMFELWNQSDGTNIYRGDCLKWYDGYKDVDEITRFVQKFEEDCAFIVAIGEDNAVHSEYGHYFKFLDLRMTVDLLW